MSCMTNVPKERLLVQTDLPPIVPEAGLLLLSYLNVCFLSADTVETISIQETSH